MKVAARRFSVFFWSWSILALVATAAHAAPVLMISIDGLKPEYMTQADAHGMKIPYLRTLIANGTYAEGVVGIWPTITYPSHTTLLTGVWPDQHGITNNQEFDPLQHFGGRVELVCGADSRADAVAGCAQGRPAHGERGLAGERGRHGRGFPDSRVLARRECFALNGSGGQVADGGAGAA